VIGNVAVLKGR